METKIFLFCLPYNEKGDVIGYAIAETGEGLASHLSSNIDWSKHDMGLTSNWKHDHYTERFPDGFELIWVDDPDTNSQLQAARDLNEQQYQLEQTKKNLEKEGASVTVVFTEY
jgi:hypothetical protein